MTDRASQRRTGPRKRSARTGWRSYREPCRICLERVWPERLVGWVCPNCRRDWLQI